jgi:hypothetical protein
MIVKRVYWRKQIFEPPPRHRRQYATLMLSPAPARRSPAYLTTPLMMLAGTALVLGLTLEILTPGGEMHWGAPEPNAPKPVARAASLSPVITPPSPIISEDRAGVVHFTVRTAGARVVVRRTDMPNAPERTVTERSLRLPAGHWVANATAPGFRNWTTYFAVRPGAPTNLFIRLKQAAPAEHAHRKRRVMSAGRRRHDRRAG